MADSPDVVDLRASTSPSRCARACAAAGVACSERATCCPATQCALRVRVYIGRPSVNMLPRCVQVARVCNCFCMPPRCACLPPRCPSALACRSSALACRSGALACRLVRLLAAQVPKRTCLPPRCACLPLKCLSALAALGCMPRVTAASQGVQPAAKPCMQHGVQWTQPVFGSRACSIWCAMDAARVWKSCMQHRVHWMQLVCNGRSQCVEGVACGHFRPAPSTYWCGGAVC